MKVHFGTTDNRHGLAVYTTDWHIRNGQRVRRIITVERHFTSTPMMRRQVSVYRINVDEQAQGGATRPLKAGRGIPTFAGALAALGGEFRVLIAEGFAVKSDLERIPVA